MKRTHRSGGGGPRRREFKPEKLEPGQRVLDPGEGLSGVVLEFACQYAHPKAAPNYSYLVRWEDGQVSAFAEQALVGENRIKPVD